jgi:hypothetical protein
MLGVGFNNWQAKGSNYATNCTLYCMALELFQVSGSNPDDTSTCTRLIKTDMLCSLGVTLYFLVMSRTPWRVGNGIELAHCLQQIAIQFSEDEVEPHLKFLLRQLLERNFGDPNSVFTEYWVTQECARPLLFEHEVIDEEACLPAGESSAGNRSHEYLKLEQANCTHMISSFVTAATDFAPGLLGKLQEIGYEGSTVPLSNNADYSHNISIENVLPSPAQQDAKQAFKANFLKQSGTAVWSKNVHNIGIIQMFAGIRLASASIDSVSRFVSCKVDANKKSLNERDDADGATKKDEKPHHYNAKPEESVQDLKVTVVHIPPRSEFSNTYPRADSFGISENSSPPSSPTKSIDTSATLHTNTKAYIQSIRSLEYMSFNPETVDATSAAQSAVSWLSASNFYAIAHSGVWLLSICCMAIGRLNMDAKAQWLPLFDVGISTYADTLSHYGSVAMGGVMILVLLSSVQMHRLENRTKSRCDEKFLSLSTISEGSFRSIRVLDRVHLLVLIFCVCVIRSESFCHNLPCLPARSPRPWPSRLRSLPGRNTLSRPALNAIQPWSSTLEDVHPGVMTTCLDSPDQQLLDRRIERELEDRLVALCGEEKVEVGRRTNISKNGLLLVGENAYICINAYRDKNGKISGVPVDRRESCQEKLRQHIWLRARPNERVNREALLCTAASRGCGKSVLQAFNLNWFVQEVPGGIGIEITFNDDQAHLWREVNNAKTMEVAIAVRALDRLVEYYERRDVYGNDFVKKRKGKLSRYKEFNSVKEAGKRFVAALQQLASPILSAVRIIRKVVGASEYSKVLLGIDEIKMAPKDTSVYPAERALSAICTAMDNDDTRTLHISASVYGCSVVSTVITRSILFQSLSPVLLQIDDEQARLLPPILQPFFDARLRQKLPCLESDLTVYAKISNLIQEAAGHPRRVQNLLTSLNSGYEVPEPFGKKEGAEFARRVMDFFSKERLAYLLRTIDDNAFMEHFEIGGCRGAEAELESLAKDTACLFAFPTRSKTAEHHRCLLTATETGHTQFIGTTSQGLLTHGYAYISLPALRQIKAFSKRVRAGPNLDALLRLTDALTDYSYDVAKTGKPFERVILQSVLLAARSNPNFSPNTWCQQHQCAFEDKYVRGGQSVRLWDNIDRFPAGGDISAELQHLVARLETEGGVGAVFQPMFEYNEGGDVYGLFKEAPNDDYTLLIMQCMDWFQNFVHKNGRKITMGEKWRSAQRPFRDAGKLRVTVNSKFRQVKPCYLLFSASDPGLSVQEGEGIITASSMRNWLPTTAYAIQLAQLTKRAFTPSE